MAASVAALFPGPAAWAQSQPSAPSPTGSRLDAVVVTGTRTPMRIDQALAETTVIDRAQIEQATGRTLAELLGQQSGVQFWANGGPGKASAVSLRGLEARHTLLLVDGVRYGSATLGTPVWENLPLDSIERIEIVRGPLSGLYGSDAVGGVVQVFTRGGMPGLQVNGQATAGAHRTAQVGGGVQFGQDAVDGSVQLLHSETRGMSATNAKLQPGNFNPDDDGLRQASGSARLGWRFAEGWRAEASLLKSDGVNHYDDGPGVDTRSGLHTEVLGVQVAGSLLAGWQTTVRASRSTDKAETLASASTSSTLGTIATVQQQLGWDNTLLTPWGTAVLLAEHLHQKVSRPGAQFAVSERTVHSLATGLSGRAGVHGWQANLRHDHNSQFGPQTTGSLGYGFDLTPAWRAAASLGTSFVQPSFNQLYFPGFGNPNLQPEEGKHAELSLRWADATQQWRMACFDNRIRGYISSGPQPANVPRIRVPGVSLSHETVWADGSLAASVEHTDPRNDTTGNANVDKQLPRRAKNSLKLSADTAVDAWRLGGTLAAFSKRFDNAANTTPVGGFGTLDLHADWALARSWTLGLKLNNVAGKTYETVYGFNQPGREGFVTLRYGGL